MLATGFYNYPFRSRVVRRRVANVLLAIGVTLVLFFQSASAIVVVNDTWKDGTRTDPTVANGYSEDKVDVDADGDIESYWWQGGNGTLTPVGMNGPLRGRFSAPTITTSASWTTHFTKESTPITLAAENDSLKLTWVFTPTNINPNSPDNSNTSQNLRFALVDTPGAIRLTDDEGPTDGAYRGYAMFTNMGATLGNSSPFRLMRRNVATGNLLSTGTNWFALGTTGATENRPGYVSGTEYTFTWEIKRNAAAELEHIVRMAGGTLDNDGLAEVIFTDTTPVGVDNDTAPFGSYKFDTFAIRPAGATTTAEIFDTKSFKVEAFLSTPPVGPGDHDGNGRVDAADYVFWRENLSTGVDAQTKYDDWRTNFGAGTGPAAGAVQGLPTVPEPAAALVFLSAITGALCVRRRVHVEL